MGEIAIFDALDLFGAHVRIQVLQALLPVCLDERKVLGPAAHRYALPAQVRKLEHVLRVNVLRADTVHECDEGVRVALLLSANALDHDDAKKLKRLSSQSSKKLAISMACLKSKNTYLQDDAQVLAIFIRANLILGASFTETNQIFKLDYGKELVAQLDHGLIALCANTPTPVRCSFPRSAKFIAENPVRISEVTNGVQSESGLRGGHVGGSVENVRRVSSLF